MNYSIKSATIIINYFNIEQSSLIRKILNMGKNNKNTKNNTKPQAKKSNKFKQRTPDNKRELDKL